VVSKRQVRSAVVNREQVLAKYWELANLDPEVTKGSITGQLKALDSLCAELSPVAADAKTQLPVPGVYRSAWMPQAGREN
jgi:hypothetical protein